LPKKENTEGCGENAWRLGAWEGPDAKNARVEKKALLTVELSKWGEGHLTGGKKRNQDRIQKKKPTFVHATFGIGASWKPKGGTSTHPNVER